MLPDVVSCTDDGRFYVLDAKYYIPSYSARHGKATVTHAPSAKDVMKQYFYYFGLAAGHAVTGGNATADATGDVRGSAGIPPIQGNAFIMPGRIAFDDPETDSRKLIALRGVVYMPFMPNVMNRLYGSVIGGSVPVFEMQPETAISLYMDEKHRLPRPRRTEPQRDVQLTHRSHTSPTCHADSLGGCILVLISASEGGRA